MNTGLQRLPLASTHRPCDVVLYWSEKDHLLLSPPYQRGLVWGHKRKVNLIRSLLLGVPIPSIVVNDRFAAGCAMRGFAGKPVTFHFDLP